MKVTRLARNLEGIDVSCFKSAIIEVIGIFEEHLVMPCTIDGVRWLKKANICDKRHPKHLDPHMHRSNTFQETVRL